jgi:hypothetical protein
MMIFGLKVLIKLGKKRKNYQMLEASYDYPLGLFNAALERLREEARELNLVGNSYDDYLRVQMMIYFKIALEVLGLLEDNSNIKPLSHEELETINRIYQSLKTIKTSEFMRVFSQYNPDREVALRLLNLR